MRFALWLIAVSIGLAAHADAATVRRVEIVVEPPFEKAKRSNEGGIKAGAGNVVRSFSRAGNRLTLPSKDATLRRELLVLEGDEWDEARATESIRVLKELPQIADARFEKRETDDPEAVDVVFTVRNQFPVELEVEVGVEGDQPEIGVPLLYNNVAGRHHSMRFDYLRDIPTSSLRQAYRWPRVGGSAWDLADRTRMNWLNPEVFGGRVKKTELDGFAAGAIASRPFRTIYDRWRAEVVVDHLEGTSVLYEGRRPKKPVFTPEGALVVEGEEAPPGAVALPLWGYRYERSTAGIVAERSFGSKWKLGIGGYADLHDTTLTHLEEVDAELVPGSPVDQGYRATVFPLDDQTTAGVIASVSWPAFAKTTNLDRYRIVEFVLNGFVLGGAMGRADEAIGAGDEYWDVRGGVDWGWNAGGHFRIAGHESVFSRRRDEGVAFEQTLVSHAARVYLRGGPWETSLVFEGAFGAGYDATGTLVPREPLESSRNDAPGPDAATLSGGAPGIGGFDVHSRPPFPLYAGASTGFRGFENNAITGDRYSRGAVELRSGSIHTSSTDWGVAVFYDAGRVWPSTETRFEDAPLLQDVGVAVRFQLLGAFPAIIRLDAAYAFSGPKAARSEVPINLVVEESF